MRLIDADKLFEEIKHNDLEFMQQEDVMTCIKDIVDRQPSILYDITSLKNNLKLNDLRSFLRAERVNLYIETGKPIKFEIYGLDWKTKTLAEYTPLDSDNPRNDVMFKIYGDYNVDEIGDDENGVLYIGIKDDMR